MKPQAVFCPNIACHARGQQNKGNIGVHSWVEQRYICHECDQTFSASKGTIFYRLRTDAATVMLVIGLLAYGCPVQAIVHAFGFDERTVKDWWRRAGAHCQVVHEYSVGQSQLDLGQVQADELKVKMQGQSVWVALAMMVSTRLWLGGAISNRRDKALIEQLAAKVRQVALCRSIGCSVASIRTTSIKVSLGCSTFLPGKRNSPDFIRAFSTFLIVRQTVASLTPYVKPI